MNEVNKLFPYVEEIEKIISYKFQDPSLLAMAFVHRSFINENRELIEEHNERLEFLGDSVLGLLVAEYLYQQFPQSPEGELSTYRSLLVDANSCISYVQTLKIEDYILLGKGEKMNDGRGRASILSDLFEALIAAIYLDGGFKAAKTFLFENFGDTMDKILQEPLQNCKALLQDFTQKNYQQTPRYEVLYETGPDHSKTFEVCVFVNDEVLGNGSGPSKKQAQQDAAEDALKNLQKRKLEFPHDEA